MLCVWRLCSLHALAIAFGLTVVLAGCSSDAGDTPEPTMEETGGVAGSETSNGGAGNVARGAGGTRASRGGSSGNQSTQTGMTTLGGGGQSTSGSCPTYVDDFLPEINAPVCSRCHEGGARAPDWGSYSQAKANCSLIGSRVASGAMPPRSSGFALTAAQKTLVADWVRLGCPETMSDLPSSCR